MIILGIESSCDETAASVVEVKRGRFSVLSNVISSQMKTHAKYGGVVPEVAARMHIRDILPVIDFALNKAKVKMLKVNYLAVCSGPGLISSLMAGVETAKTLAYAFNKKLIAVNHIEGHLLAGFDETIKPKELPAIGLIVSGGHSQIILIKKTGQYELIGQTRDDAAGEAFDKVAKILKLGYPGGPAIFREADKLLDEEVTVELPRPMLNANSFDMSFSGLKTAVLYLWRDLQKEYRGKSLYIKKSEVAREFQNAVVDVLTLKTIKAMEKFQAKSVILGGGVSANLDLRKNITDKLQAMNYQGKLHLPAIELTGDNAVMIAKAAYYHARNKKFISPFKLKADPNWELV